VDDQLANLILHIEAGPQADQEEQALLTQRLREHLLQLNVEDVGRVNSDAAPPGAKGDAVTLATLAVTLAPIALAEVMKALQTWLSRHERASVAVESGGEKIVVTGSPSKEQQRAIETFLSRHRP
jgi:hypothetical protein